MITRALSETSPGSHQWHHAALVICGALAAVLRALTWWSPDHGVPGSESTALREGGMITEAWPCARAARAPRLTARSTIIAAGGSAVPPAAHDRMIYWIWFGSSAFCVSSGEFERRDDGGGNLPFRV